MAFKYKHLIKYIDFLGEDIKLNIKGEHQIKTIIGATLTIMIVVVLATATWLMGSDMLYKQKPVTDVQELPYKQRPFIYLTNETFPIAFCLQRYDQKVFDIKSYFRMEVIDWKAFNTNQTSTSKTYEFEQCTYDHFPKIENKTYLVTAGITNYYCLKNQNITIGGYWDNDFIEYSIFRIRLCDNQTDGGACAPKEEINQFFNKELIAFNLYVQNTIFDLRNYTSPEQIYLLNLFKNVKLTSRKSFNIFIREQELASDDGFMFEDITNYTSISYDTSDVDDADISESSLMDINLFVAPHKMYYYRYYIKIQTVLANFGGTADALFIIGHSIAMYFAHINLNQKLMNKIFDFNLEQKKGKPMSNSLGKDMEILHKLAAKLNNSDKSAEGNKNSSQAIETSNKDINARNKANFINVKVIEIKSNPYLIDMKSKDNIRSNRNSNSNLISVNSNNSNNSASHNKNNPDDHGKHRPKKSFTLSDIVNTVMKKNPDKKLKLLFTESLKKPFFYACSNPKQRTKYKLFDKASSTLKDYMDITSIVKQLEEFQKLKVILLNSEQLAMFQFVAKEECSLEDKVELRSKIAKLKAFVSDHERMVQIILDYKEKLDSEGTPISPLDKKLFEVLDDDIKKMI
jgi:hypothetical protein